MPIKLVHITHSLFDTIIQKHWVRFMYMLGLIADDGFLIVFNKVQEEKKKVWCAIRL